jgi:hypothetical protein
MARILKHFFRNLFTNSRSVFPQKHFTLCMKGKQEYYKLLHTGMFLCASDVGWAGGHHESSGH